MNIDQNSAKRAATILRGELAKTDAALTHGRALEIVAHQLGYRDWNTAAALLGNRAGPNHGAVPVLRILDERAAREFYLDYLGFTVAWEHRFEPGMPLYLRVVRSDIVLDLSEHYGDGTPGGVVWIPVDDVEALHDELIGKKNTGSRPGIDHDAPGGPTMSVIDPFANVLRFCEPTGS